MTIKSPKPVKECEGCKLNQGDRCAVFPYPHEQWYHKDCEGYNDPDLIKKYRLNHDDLGAHGRKLKRQEEAKNEHTVEHEGGRHGQKKNKGKARKPHSG